jgi:soluble lytic murein transglycosylase
MAQQLATLRTPAAYAGVTKYAHSHTGEAAAAAYLALGHAYLLDKRYAEAESRPARLARPGGAGRLRGFSRRRGEPRSGQRSAAEGVLHGFAERYPDSIFDARRRSLRPMSAGDEQCGGRAAGAGAAAGTAPRAVPAFSLQRARWRCAGPDNRLPSHFKRLLLGHPLSPEAQIARAKLTAMGAESSLTVAELRSLGDAYYNAGRYEEAASNIARWRASRAWMPRPATALPWPRRPAS